LVAFLALFIGIALIGCAAQAKVINSDISNEIFQVWVGVPVSIHLSNLQQTICLVNINF